MAEGLGIARSIIALLQATQTVITYVREVNGANEERSDILKEANSLYHFLLMLEDKAPDHVQPGDTWFTMFELLEAPEGPLEQFRLLLERLTSKLKSAKAFKKFGNTLFWPFRGQEVKDILENIERQKTLIILALENDHMCFSPCMTC